MEHGEIPRLCTGIIEMRWDCWDWDRSVISPPTSLLRSSRKCRVSSCVILPYCCAEDSFQTYRGSVEKVLEDLHFPSCVCCVLRKGQEQHMS